VYVVRKKYLTMKISFVWTFFLLKTDPNRTVTPLAFSMGKGKSFSS
jgi:hypothetical protein